MTLRPCRECGSIISSQASRCPRCGARLWWGLFVSVGVAAGIVVLAGAIVAAMVGAYATFKDRQTEQRTKEFFQGGMKDLEDGRQN